MTPYYEQDGITIYHCDYIDVLPAIHADVIVTDPPYGTGAYATDQSVMTSEVLRAWTVRFRSVAIFGWPEKLAALCGGIEPSEWVTWWPTNKISGRGLTLPRESEHVALFGTVEDSRCITRERTKDKWARRVAVSRGLSPDLARDGDVWRIPSPGMSANAHQRNHPNEKPVELMLRLLLLVSDGVVVDPFMGSGTTLVAAKRLSRKAIGIEVNEAYCEIAAKRLSQGALPLEFVS